MKEPILDDRRVAHVCFHLVLDLVPNRKRMCAQTGFNTLQFADIASG